MFLASFRVGTTTLTRGHAAAPRDGRWCRCTGGAIIGQAGPGLRLNGAPVEIVTE